jgi:predicted RNA-binding Zn-ribbon protein involved in translation (DUF1610 family)
MAITKWALAHANPLTTIVCVGCGKSVMRRVKKTRDQGKYCSRACAFADPNWRSLDKAKRKAIAKPQRSKALRHCECGRVLHHYAMKLCPRCRDSREAQLREKPVRVCVVCGSTFTAKTFRSTTCSSRCARKTQPYRKAQAAVKRRRRAIYGNDRARKKARRLGVPYEPISRAKVFIRDGWRCQLCNRSTPRRVMGRMVSNAPELDHIVPWAKGGAHIYDNVQCLCRKCNGAKAAAIRGQLRLLLEVKDLTGGQSVLDAARP